ncbi:MAG: FAD-dependent oxidoreductase [Herminiimonas sp.]|nr:FAD-dependent oxidoreductase [Herminiimonas sp.]
MKAPGAKLRVAVVGAGWAGCAAAVELSLQGHQVHLLEASRTFGGRARGLRRSPDATASWEDKLDNGQHILLGAYRETLRLMRTVGVDVDRSLLRLPMQMRYPAGDNGMDFVAAKLPAPLHLALALWRATGLARADKVALARFTTAARWIDWRLNADCSVTQLLLQVDQTERLVALLWRPLCIAALNTPPERASAQIFLNVLRDSLGARRAASDMLVPRVDLGALFPDQAARFLTQRGADVRLAVRVTTLNRQADGWQLETSSAEQPPLPVFDRVILATPFAETARLLAGAGQDVSLLHFDYEPITTCYLQYGPGLGLALPLYALRDDAERACWGQFVFDRGQLDIAQAGLLAVVISASGAAVALAHDVLCSAVTRQLARVFEMPELLQPLRSKIISEKRATFSCTPGMVRPGAVTALDGVLLAGDYVAGDYPATIEGAVRSGVQAAANV